MDLDAATLTAALLVVCTVLAGLLALTWAQNRSVPAFGVWTISFALCAAAAAMLALRDFMPALVAVDIAIALRFLAFGLAWKAARHFTGRKGNWFFALAPALGWIIAAGCLPLGGEMRTRVLVAAPVVAAYAFALGFELWRAAPRFRWIAWPAGILLAMHGTVFAARFLVALLDPGALVDGDVGIAAPLHPLAILEMIVVAIALAFLLLSAAKEEIGMRHRQAALLDPLTGIANRRGFDIEVERVFAQARQDGAPMALLLFDLDNFKEINDGFGHPAGDRILRTLARTVSAYIRPGDVLGRLGGDEFAILLSNTRVEQALVLAERVRRAVAAMVVRTDPEIRLTASVGVAGSSGAASSENLFEDADAALYRAKALGRNRVESAPARSPVSEARSQRRLPERDVVQFAASA